MGRIIKGAWMKLDAPIKKKAKASAVAANSVYQLKIALHGAKPPIWRRVRVSASTLLPQLHAVIQAAMGWQDCHLHVFEVGDDSYTSAVPDEMTDSKSEQRVALKKIAPALKSKFKYEYDMGDGWLHVVTVEKILEADPEQKLPICTAGAGACPPEDCGGLWGYYAMLDTLEDVRHPEHDRMKRWVGDDFDADFFDIEASNKRLKKLRDAKPPTPR